MPSECSLPQKSSIKLDAAIPNLKYSGGLVGAHNYAFYVGDPDRNYPGIILWDGPRATQWTGIDAVADFGEVGGWGGSFKEWVDASHVSKAYKDGFDSVRPPSLSVNYFIRAK